MKVRGVMIGLMCVVLPAAAWAGAQDEGKAQFAQGNELLKKGEFEGAARAFEAAAKAEPNNQAYQIRLMIVQRVVSMRETLDQQTDDEKWMSVAKALHTFYYDNGVQDQALALATKAHSKLNTTETAVMLARSRLALGMNSEAAEGLRGITQAKVNAEVRALLGIALARQGQKDEAKKLLKTMKDGAADEPQYNFDLARLHALLGDSKEAVGALVCCFENTPPSALDAMKERAQGSEDFKLLQDKSDFQKAFETKSKVAESKCSQGPDCGKCPMKKKCQGKHEGKPQGNGNGQPAKP